MLPKTDRKIHSGIYAIICRENGISYPGRAKDILDRYRKHLQSLRRKDHHCDYLQYTFNKYGENSLFIIIIEDDVPHDQLKIREQIYLDFVRENKKFFFNSSCSADGPEMNEQTINKLKGQKRTEEHKNKISLAHKNNYENGYINPNKDKPMSEEQKEKISNEWKQKYENGYISPNKNKPKSKESCEKMSNSKKEMFKNGYINPLIGTIRPKDVVEKVAIKHRKPIKQIDPNTNEIIKIWDSTKEAAAHFNLKNGSPITSSLKKRTKISCGFKWEYLN